MNAVAHKSGEPQSGGDQSNKQSVWIRYVLTVVVLGVMTAAAEITGEREIIFPEITAVAIGALIAPVQSWNTNRVRLFVSIICLAITGVLIVRYIPLPLYCKIPLSFACAVVGLIISKTGFVPMISACVLPVILGTETFVYVFSVIAMTGIILGFQILLEKKGLYKSRAFVPVKTDRKSVVFWLKHIVVIAVVCAVPALTGQLFFVVPPLIVGYVEMSMPRSKLKVRYQTAILLIVVAACVGAFSRLLIVEALGLPLTLAATISGIAVLAAVHKTKLFFPPCGAICTLPMLLPADGLMLYPLKVSIGFIILVAIALVIFKDKPAENGLVEG